MDKSELTQIVHASCVSLDNKAVLIRGESGSGKSALALQLVALGACLVADDRTVVCRSDGTLVASAPPEISGLIEARGIGILRAEAAASGEVVLVVDLDRAEMKRFPDRHDVELCGLQIPCLHKIQGAYFPAAILQYLKGGRQDPS
ncbi:MAG: HPr kinase/phosphatase C-terminal domain-containing protein [Pseudomonadota bacterium]